MTELPPPRCLRSFDTRPTTDPGVDLDAVVDEWENRFLAVSCRCGGEAMTVLGVLRPHWYLKAPIARGPLSFGCIACRRDREAFDPGVHGYDSEMDHFPDRWKSAEPPRRYPCPGCASTEFALVARFQYPDSVLASPAAGETVPGTGRRVRPEDLFSYFTLLGRCRACGAWTTITSIECS